MCGIVVAESERAARDALAAIAHRGPDGGGIHETASGLWLGQARLAIRDPDPRSDCPFVYGGVVLVYNGELWNAEELRVDLEAGGSEFSTTGDTEIVAAALDRWGSGALDRLDGMFAIAWEDSAGLVWIARDRYGEVPLHVAERSAASELKGIAAAGIGGASWLPPGSLRELTREDGPVSYYQTPLSPVEDDLVDASPRVRKLVHEGTRRRCVSDVPVCTLLSGGIDSSAIALAVAEEIPDVVAYIAVFDPKARDLRTARIVAEALGMELVEVAVPVPSPENLAEVVRVVEMPHKAQVEIGWPCLRLADAMRSDGAKVTFSGEGSDELWASYAFAYHGLKTADWHTYRRDLFIGQHRKNFARANKVFLSRGVECRLPFLHRPLVEYAISLKRDAVRFDRRPKAVLEEAYRGDLPDEVVNRPKVAFQDGMGIKRKIADAVHDPRRFYRAVYKREFGRVASRP